MPAWLYWDSHNVQGIYYQAWENAKDKEESKNLIFEDVNGSPIQTIIHQNDGWSRWVEPQRSPPLERGLLSSCLNAINSQTGLMDYHRF